MKIQLPVKAMSVNKAWQGRRFKTPEYHSYEKEVAVFLPREKVSGIVEIFYTFHLKNHKLTDCSNLIKLLEDIIVKCGLIDDDRYVYSFHVKKLPAETDSIDIDIVPYTLGV